MSDTRIYKDHLRGVGCEVESCKYHTSENYCSANRITVESENAVRKAETFCSTFVPSASI